MDLFKPELSLVRETDGTYTLHSLTLTPTSCYRAAGTAPGTPAGFLTSPETVACQLRLACIGDGWLQVITPVIHRVPHLVMGPGRDTVTAFVTLDGKVVGVSSIRGAAAQEALFENRREAGGRFASLEQPAARCLTKAKAGEIVIASCPRPVTSIDQQLNEVGVTDEDTQALFVENVRDRIVQGGCQIDRADIPNDPANTVMEVRDAVSRAAH